MNSFKRWYTDTFDRDEMRDMAKYGCDSGFHDITYTSDCIEIYDKYEDDIYAMLRQDSEDYDYASIDAFVASFKRKDMLDSPDTRKNLLVWYACERVAYDLVNC